MRESLGSIKYAVDECNIPSNRNNWKTFHSNSFLHAIIHGNLTVIERALCSSVIYMHIMDTENIHTNSK